ncbi:IS66-like element accessory protein TnpA [Chelatococcus asaccharovorans]|uniref:Transposase n=1 Tax=Chelatococcus asaccharovorans TaxID=28210 RepID=A0A2V3TQ07_9HYPH|nr:transposase [Chelatococcus asaccharovorans]MBS7705197.1 transposase [Chelatococcus asaccharovorans]MBS7707974.1 transposase [Chelatococcus asaccharovorans]PXW49903.1 transposase [Chelatococcus asaccharovorans]
MRQEVLIGVERRRRWPTEQKLQILSEVGVDGATVADVARRHDISRQQIYQWRRDMRRGSRAEEAPHFLPVELHGGEVRASGSAFAVDDRRLEIGLRNGRTIRIMGNLPDSLLARVIRIAETA